MANPKIAGIEIRIDELKRSGPLFYGWVTGLLIIIGIGLYAYFLQLTKGLVVTGMRDTFPWGIYIQNCFYFVGVSSGGLVIYASVQLFGAKKFKPLSRIAILQAAVSVFLAVLFLMPDIGRPLLSYQFVTSPNFRSIFFYDFLILGTYLILCLIDMWVMITGTGGHKLEFTMTVISFPAAIGLHTITAWILGFARAVELWNTALMPPMFLSSAMASGIAILILVALLIQRFSKIRFKEEMFHAMAKVLVTVIFVDLFILSMEIINTFWWTSQKPGHAERMLLLLTGKYAPLFIPQLTVFGVLPFLLLLIPKTRKSMPIMAISCVLYAIGIFIKRFALLAMGFGMSPLGPFNSSYMPTLLEVLVTLMPWALGILIMTLAVKLLPLEVPEHVEVSEHG